MTGLALLPSLAAFLASIHTAASTPIAFEALYPRNETYPTNETVWPDVLFDQVHDETWSDFVEKTTRWSTYEAPTFDLVFLPETEEDLALGLKYVSTQELPFLAKSGGHGYSPTLKVIQDGVLINLDNFNYVRMEDDGTAVVGTGARFRDLINAVAAAGRELTVGSCPCVGSTGAMLGGGLGRLQGLHGLTSDAVRKVRVALWNGTFVEASDEFNQDLFWGVRGSGQNYGIITETTYETWPATNGGMHYNADMVFTKDSVETIIETVNNLTSTGLDERLAFVIFFALDAATSGLSVIVNLVYSGPMEEGQKYTELFSPFSLSLEENMIPWEELPTRSVLGLLPASCATGNRNNLYSVILRHYDPKAFVEFSEAFEQFLQDYPAANASAMMLETFPVQGVEALPDDYSAFPHRNNFHNQYESFGTYTDDSLADVVDDFFREWRNRLAQPDVSGYDRLYIYQNYAHDDEPLSALYGYDDWRHQRLTDLKNKYDPRGVFNGYHAVPSDVAEWS